MTKKPFLLGMHFTTKALGDIEYPIDKSDLLAKVGERQVQLDWNVTITLRELIEPSSIDRFESAASLFNALTSSLTQRSITLSRDSS